MNYFDVLFAKKQSGGGTPTLITKSITANGTYTASEDNADGYSQVTVAVEGFKKKSIANTPTDIASFDDGTANPMPSLEISIVPVQSGSGDPSPSNVRPISGWSGANVTRCGVNLFDKDSTTVSNVTFEGPSGTTTRSGFKLTLPNGNYSLKCFGATAQNYIYVYKNNAGNYIDVYKLSATGGWQGVDISVSTDDELYIVAAVSGATLDLSFDLVIIAGTTPPTTYSPYQGSTASIPFHDSSDNPVTVYGGRLNVTSGELTVDRAKRTLSANDTFVKLGDITVYLDTWLDIVKPTSSELGLLDCSHYKEVLQSSAIDNCIAKPINNRAIIFYDSVHATSVNDFKAYITEQINNNTPIEVVYKLATPQTYQLTPAQVTTLLNQNNIFADCGQILQGEYFVTS